MNTGPMPVSLYETSQAVVVVPMLAPSITPSEARKVSVPASTRATVMAEMALELWTMPVARAPTAIPRMRLAVTRASQRRITGPATACSSWLKDCSPCRKRITAAVTPMKIWKPDTGGAGCVRVEVGQRRQERSRKLWAPSRGRTPQPTNLLCA